MLEMSPYRWRTFGWSGHFGVVVFMRQKKPRWSADPWERLGELAGAIPN
jgi:hypothetical protein